MHRLLGLLANVKLGVKSMVKIDTISALWSGSSVTKKVWLLLTLAFCPNHKPQNSFLTFSPQIC
jgi:hypothetical protein